MFSPFREIIAEFLL